MLFLLLGCTLDADPAIDDWALIPSDLGAPVVEGSSFSPTDGEAVGGALSQLLPHFGEGMPTWDLPMAAWEIILAPRVADEGSCPYEELDGSARVYRSECRSSQGYEWTGGVRTEAWTADDGTDHERFGFDVEVLGDVDSKEFDRVWIAGGVERQRRGDVEHVDVNLQLAVEGYFEANGGESDPRVPLWAEWAASGSLELEGDTLRVEQSATVGGSGVIPMVGTLEASGDCPVEPTGDLSLGSEAVARFEGAGGCDACAIIETEDGSAEACAP